jgi:uncharacterized protein (DUF433 family)
MSKIVSTRTICNGNKRIAGTRITVSSILDALAYGMSLNQIYKLYKKHGSRVEKQDLEEAVRYSSKIIKA